MMAEQNNNHGSGRKVKAVSVIGRSVLTIFLAATLGTAQANSLSIANQSSSFDINNYNGDSRWIATGYKTAGVFGALNASGPGTLSVTYLGNSGIWLDQFSFGSSAGGGILDEACCIGRSITAQVGAGIVDFQFEDDHLGFIKNGGTQSTIPGFAFLLDNKQSSTFAASFNYRNNRYDFQYLLGFNDSWAGDKDFDDLVVGVNFTPSPAPIPLPAAAWLFGSVLFGFISLSNRRRV